MMKQPKRIIISDLFVERMERYRSGMNLSQAEFAAKIGLSLSGYKNILNARTRTMEYNRFLKLAYVTQKIFWIAFLLDESLIPLAEAYDEYEYYYYAKFDSFLNLYKIMKQIPPTNSELASTAEYVRIIGRFITSKSYQYWNNLPIDRPVRVKKGNIESRYDLNVDSESKRVREYISRLERFRAEMGKSQAEFASILGYSLSGYKKMLSKAYSRITVEEIWRYSHILEKVSLGTALTGDKLDGIALALDESNLSYELKRYMMGFMDSLYDEFGLTQEYIDGVVYRIKHLGEHYEQLDGICKANP